MSNLRIMVVDDHPIVRSGLKALIEGEPDMSIVGEAVDGETAVNLAAQVQPDIVVMDLSLPGLGGTDATRQICQHFPQTRVIALTAHEEPAYLTRVISAGASGFVLKRSAAEELVGAIRHAAADRTYLDPAVAKLAVTELGRQVHVADHESLSERETEVLKFVARGFSNKQIATELGLSVKTIETYKYRAMEKLGAKSRVDVVRYATDKGWFNDSP